jgi:hypothetical protein
MVITLYQAVTVPYYLPVQIHLPTGTKNYNYSMYQPTRFPLSVGNARSDLKPPPVIGFGLEEIVAMIATNDAFEYQEGQVFFGLGCTLYLETFFPTVGTRGSACKWYTDGMYT